MPGGVKTTMLVLLLVLLGMGSCLACLEVLTHHSDTPLPETRPTTVDAFGCF